MVVTKVTGKRIFIGSGYIQGTTSWKPRFWTCINVVEFFPTNNPETRYSCRIKFSQVERICSSLKVGNTEITGDLTVDGSIIHGGRWWWYFYWI